VTYPKGGRTRLRVLVAVMALAVGFAAAVVPVSPAAASPGDRALVRGERVCWEFWQNGKLVVRCIYLPELVEIDFPPRPCPVCGGLTLEFPEVLPDDRRVRVMEALGEGFGLLGKAEQVTDRERVQALRDGAMAQFTAAAVASTGRDVGLPVPVTGYLVEAGVFEPAEIPELAEAGDLTVEGLAVLAATDPDIDPAAAAQAQELFDKAFDRLSGAGAG
jgi:hypothetical protein